MDLEELATPKGEAIDLRQVGDKFDGVIVAVGEFRPITGKYGTVDKVPITLMVDGEQRTHWLPKGCRRATVIAEAVKAAGATALLKGGRLQVVRVEDVPTNKGNAMHDFAAKYTPPATGGGLSASDLFD